jgi:hypothetical protein
MATLVPFTIDLAAHEATRLATVLDTIGPLWDPADIYAGEAEAHRLLYAHLDPEQQATYDLLMPPVCYPTPVRGDEMFLDRQAGLGRCAWLPCHCCHPNAPLYRLDPDVTQSICPASPDPSEYVTWCR